GWGEEGRQEGAGGGRREAAEQAGVRGGGQPRGGAEDQGRRQRAQQGGEQDQGQAQGHVAVVVLRPGGAAAGDRHGSDQGQADDQALRLVGLVPGPQRQRHQGGEGERHQQAGRQPGGHHRQPPEQLAPAGGVGPQPGVEQQQGQH